MKTLLVGFVLLIFVNASLQTSFFAEWLRENFGLGAHDPKAGRQLVWAEDFDSGDSQTDLDHSKWWRQVMPGSDTGNSEWEFYTDRIDNSYMQNGNLVIQAQKESFQNYNYTSGKILSNESWTYGYFEARAKVPKGEGFWPAIWMLPIDNDKNYGPWPAEGEIDIMESVNSAGTFPYGCQTTHFGGFYHDTAGTKVYDHHQAPQSPANCTPLDDWDQYHTWGVEWTPAALVFYIDGNQTSYIDGSTWFSWDEATNQHWPAPAPFDKNFHWILNFAIGGSWPGYNIDESKLPAQMLVDYVHVYQ